MSATETQLKRKREVADTGDLEIDLSLPEPLSKKALRQAKKSKAKLPEASAAQDTNESNDQPENAAGASVKNEVVDQKKAARSEWGIWIGNLPWSVTKQDMRDFLCKDTSIADQHITRVHMPAPAAKVGDEAAINKPKNRGFAYVDFDSSEHCDAAMKLSETLLLGRRVLIKNAKSFEGRPERDPAAAAGKEAGGKPPNKRVFVGNLGFDVAKADLEKHFAQCGEVADVHMATFEDSGKCKGFAWVTFVDIEAAQKAVAGYIVTELEADEKGRKRTKKWWVNKMHGRMMRCEFAEDAAVRYQKRFARPKHKAAEQDNATTDNIKQENGASAHDRRRSRRAAVKAMGGIRNELRGLEKQAKHPSMEARPPKGTGAIVESEGNRIQFE